MYPALKVDILVHPSLSEPELEPKPAPKARPRWKIPHRIKLLAVPKHQRRKYVRPPFVPRAKKVYEPLDPETAFRNEHLSRGPLRTLVVNKKLFTGIIIDRHVKNINKFIDKAWDAIYNYYKKKFREKRLKRLQRIKQRRMERAKKKQGKKTNQQIQKEKIEHILSLAHPKKIFQPEPINRPRKALEDLLGALEVLAQPKSHPVPPPRPLSKVASGALVYEITEAIMKLYKIPDRLRRRKSEPLPLVAPTARFGKVTPRLEELAKPSLGRREAKKQEDDRGDPWAIPERVLKYKPTARILELAKPRERD